jgi:hypothetical protein
MNKPSRRFDMILRKIILGINKDSKFPNPEQVDVLKESYKDSIVWVDENIPRQLAGKAVSIGVLGAITKGVICHGIEKMQPFCDALSKGNFDGVGDPAHILWLWLTGNHKYDCDEAYRKTIAAIRAYVSGKKLFRIRKGIKLNGTFAKARTDLFEWDSTYTKILLGRGNNKSSTVLGNK